MRILLRLKNSETKVFFQYRKTTGVEFKKENIAMIEFSTFITIFNLNITKEGYGNELDGSLPRKITTTFIRK
jgi:hypothetical protein